MERRNFLQLAALALAGQAAQRVWPFRVYSIPKKIVVAPITCHLAGDAFYASLVNEAEGLFGLPVYAQYADVVPYMGLSRSMYPPGFWPVKEISLEEMRRCYPMSWPS